MHTAFALVLQMCLAGLALAAPIPMNADGTVSVAENTWQYGAGGGVFGFIVLILDILVFSAFTLFPFLSIPILKAPPLSSRPLLKP
jgi:hypothetical protein